MALEDGQYRDPGNLNARVAVHRRFSTNPTGWQRWVFDQLEAALAGASRADVLEVGAGPGRLWAENLDRLPAGWRVTLSDRSPGMVAAARAALSGRALAGAFEFAVADVQALPCADAAFDAVVANHMLYHVEDRPRALAEIRRVLRPGGRLLAATVGAAHLAELDALLARFPDGPRAGVGRIYPEFTLENGAAQLSPRFPQVDCRRYPDALAVTEAEPLAAYVLSTVAHDDPLRERAAELGDFFRAALARRGGVLHIAKDSGLFVTR